MIAKMTYDRFRQIVPQVILNVIIWALLFLMLYPLAMAIWNALKLDYTFSSTKWYPTFPLVITNLSEANSALDTYIWNTVEVGVLGGGGLVLIASLSAYTFAKMNFPGRKALYAIVIALLMIPRAVRLLVSAGRVLLGETPEGLDLGEVRRHLEEVPRVVAVHDLHASTVATGMPILTAHVVVDRDVTMRQAGDVLARMQDCLREHFPVSIGHTTFQLEPEGYDSPSSEQLHA